MCSFADNGIPSRNMIILHSIFSECLCSGAPFTNRAIKTVGWHSRQANPTDKSALVKLDISSFSEMYNFIKNIFSILTQKSWPLNGEHFITPQYARLDYFSIQELFSIPLKITAIPLVPTRSFQFLQIFFKIYLQLITRQAAADAGSRSYC